MEIISICITVWYDDMIIYLENLRGSVIKLTQMVEEFSKLTSIKLTSIIQYPSYI